VIKTKSYNGIADILNNPAMKIIEQTEKMNRIFNSPFMQIIQRQQKRCEDLMGFTSAIESIIQAEERIKQITAPLEELYDFNNIMNSIEYVMNSIPNIINNVLIDIANSNEIFSAVNLLKDADRIKRYLGNSLLYKFIEEEIREIPIDNIPETFNNCIDWEGFTLSDVDSKNPTLNNQVEEKCNEKHEYIKLFLIVFLMPLIVNILSNTIYDNTIAKNNKIAFIRTENIIEDYFVVESVLNNENRVFYVGDRVINPRVKPNCSSAVVGSLEPGRVVYAIEKKKKWIHILWKNEKGEEYSGWIQNWKLEYTILE